MTHILKGHYRNESGTLETGTLLVERIDGVFYEPYQGVLTARTFEVTSDLTDTEITASMAVFEFIPDAGECERIGMPILPIAS